MGSVELGHPTVRFVSRSIAVYCTLCVHLYSSSVIEVRHTMVDMAQTLLRSISKKLSKGREEEETEDFFTDEVEEIDVRLNYDEILSLIKCGMCGLVSSSTLQCRKGHVFCKSCKLSGKLMQCNTCQQTLLQAPNAAFDKLLSLVTLPCRNSGRGCLVHAFPEEREEHEQKCMYRPQTCQYSIHGCTIVLPRKDICWHHRMCDYAKFPHTNVITNMPTKSRKKSIAQSNDKTDKTDKTT